MFLTRRIYSRFMSAATVPKKKKPDLWGSGLRLLTTSKTGRLIKSPQVLGARNLRNEAYVKVRCSDEG
jgi:hypothetical protein